MIQRHQPLECLSPPLVYELPEACQQLKKGFRDCKRGMVDMRKRFRGNQPISVSNELEGEGSRPVGQLYGGKPAFEAPMKEGARGEISGLGFDEDKTRGL